MNRRITAFITLATFCLTLPAFSQPAIEYLRQYDTGRNEGFHDVYPVSDGGFIACGGAFTEEADYSEWHTGDRYVVRTDSSGRELWSLRLGGLVRAKSVIETDAGDFLVGGGVDNHFFAFRVSADGDLLWSRDYFAGSCNAVIELKDGDFLLAGRNIPGRDANGCLVRIDGDGEVVWTNNYDPPFQGYGSLYAVRETEGGVIAVGGGWAWAIKAELGRGELIWSHVYRDGPDRGSVNGDATTLISSHDGNFIMGGYTDGGFIIKFDLEGEQIWCKRATDRDAYVLCLSRIEGGGFVGIGPVMVRIDNRTSFSRWAAWRFDSDGNRIWEQIYAFDEDDRYAVAFNRPYSVVTSGTSIIVAGALRNEGGEGDWDAVLMRLEPDVLGPQVFYRLPEDSLLTVLQHDSVTFVVRARSRYHEEMNYKWFVDDDERGSDTTETIRFDDWGVSDVVCRVSNVDATINVRWHVTVTEVIITDFTPDDLNLTLRRGSEVDFAIDEVRYSPGGEPEYHWTKINLVSNESEDLGQNSHATIDFPWSGDFTVEGKVFHGESRDSVLWNVAVRGAIWGYVPVPLTFDVEPDNVVHFEIVPSEPENESLSIQWLVDGEVAAEDTVALEWAFGIAGGEADSCPPYQVQCVVADSVEADTVTWEVTVRDLAVPHDGSTADPPRSAGILSVSPNPFNSMLTIRFSGFPTARGGVSQSPHAIVGGVSLRIYDLSGREVFSTVSPPRLTVQQQPPVALGGATVERTVVWNAASAPAGVYLVRLQSGTSIFTRKVVLMR